jgi:CBS domain-containing protein
MLRSVKVRDYMMVEPVLVYPDTELFRAISLILANKISGVTVVDEQKRPVGILSELDALRAIMSGTYYKEDAGTILVRDHMTVDVECVGPDENIIEVAQSMLQHKRRRRPVVDSMGVMIGQVTCRQLLKAMKDFDSR